MDDRFRNFATDRIPWSNFEKPRNWLPENDLWNGTDELSQRHACCIRFDNARRR
jgi:hypothetical protein